MASLPLPALACSAALLDGFKMSQLMVHVLNPDNGILDSGARLTFFSLHPASSVSVAGNRPAPSLVFPSEVGCVGAVSFSKKRIETRRHGGRRTTGRLNSEPLSLFPEGQRSGRVNK